MSRPFRTRIALCLLAFSVGLTACDTIYRPVYTNQKNYFQAPVALNSKGQREPSAEEVIKGLPETSTTPDSGALPPPPPAAPDAAPPAAPPAATPPPP